METIMLPENKPLINGKYANKDGIKSALYKLFAANKIEGRYSDESWVGVQKLYMLLNENDIEFSLDTSYYDGHGQAENSTLPTRKIYILDLQVRDRAGKNIPLKLKVNCSFVGKTGTMADSNYEVTFYFLD